MESRPRSGHMLGRFSHKSRSFLDLATSGWTWGHVKVLVGCFLLLPSYFCESLLSCVHRRSPTNNLYRRNFVIFALFMTDWAKLGNLAWKLSWGNGAILHDLRICLEWFWLQLIVDCENSLRCVVSIIYHLIGDTESNIWVSPSDLASIFQVVDRTMMSTQALIHPNTDWWFIFSSHKIMSNFHWDHVRPIHNRILRWKLDNIDLTHKWIRLAIFCF